MSDGVSSGAGSGEESETRKISTPGAAVEVPTTAVGAAVSRYVVLEQIGQGGMGRILRAYDPKLQREVALKEVRAHLLDAEATARLVSEARAMAKLSHPNVVAVFDVEEKRTGELFVVMEYVAGTTLKGWLREAKRDWQEVVARFIGAGRGLAAAHDAGLLHRDFKPANVLVSEAGGVKVTDFGLAKASTTVSEGSSHDNHSQDDQLTEAGTLLGTPRYMAPEQHAGRALSPAADQYAFCVALWEALCGTPPFSGALMKMETDKASGPPTWTERSTPRPIVNALLRGLSPEPADRWPNMDALLEVLAWDPSRRRKRWALALAGAGAVAVAGVSYDALGRAGAARCQGAKQQLDGIWDADRSDAVRAAMLGIDQPYAQLAWERAQTELSRYAEDWAVMHTETCEATTIRGEQSPQMLDLRMGCLQRAAVELQAAVDVLADADADVVQRAHGITGGLRPLSRCADTEALTADVEPPLPAEAEAVDQARTRLAQAATRVRGGRYEDALHAVREAETVLEGVEYGPIRTELAGQLAQALDRLGRYEESEAALVEALRHAAQWKQWRAMASAAEDLVVTVGYHQQRFDEALQYQALAEGLVKGDPKAEASWHDSLGLLLYVQGRYDEAEAENRAALALEIESRGPDHPYVAASRNNLANVLYARGHYAEAEAEFRAALELTLKSLGPDHPKAAASRNNIGSVLDTLGRYAEAEAEHRAALAIRRTALGPDHPDVAASRSNLAISLAAQGHLDEAETEHRAALAIRQAALGPDHMDVANSHLNLGIVLSDKGQLDEAEAEMRAAATLCEATLGPDHPCVAYAHHYLAAVLEAQGRLDDALPSAKAAWTQRQRNESPLEERAQSSAVLASILWEIEGPARDRPRARKLAQDALDGFRQAGTPHAEDADELQRWLEDHPLP